MIFLRPKFLCFCYEYELPALAVQLEWIDDQFDSE